MNADQRAAYARQYLTTAQRDLAALPRPVLELTATTLRHHLAQVLAAADGQAPAAQAGSYHLTGEQQATVLAALDDASEGIRERAAYCPACRRHPADLCDEDADRLARAEAYDRLAAVLRGATQ